MLRSMRASWPIARTTANQQSATLGTRNWGERKNAFPQKNIKVRVIVELGTGATELGTEEFSDVLRAFLILCMVTFTLTNEKILRTCYLAPGFYSLSLSLHPPTPRQWVCWSSVVPRCSTQSALRICRFHVLTFNQIEKMWKKLHLYWLIIYRLFWVIVP